ncbi:MAG: thiolase family protein [Acidimicrobiales bacterium]
MSGIEVLGYGVHPFGRFPDKLPAAMARTAIERALASAVVPLESIDAVYTGHSNPESGGGAAVLAASGIRGIPVINLDQACASSATAIALAALALRAGEHERVLVVGFEKMGSGFVRLSQPHGGDDEFLGFDLQPVRYALKASRYLDMYGAEESALAEVTVKSRTHSALNGDAHMRSETSVEEVLTSPMVSSPLTRLQCCPTSDGAAAVVLGRAKGGARSRRARIASWSIGTPEAAESRAVGVPESFTSRLARQAYELAGIGPGDVEVAQVHDAFTIAEPLRLEALSLVPEGEGLVWTAKGMTSLGGRLPTNTDGGLLGRGHPVGATGVAQLIEIARQLNGDAGARQIEPRPSVGLCQNLGGGENGGGVVMVVKR